MLNLSFTNISEPIIIEVKVEKIQMEIGFGCRSVSNFRIQKIEKIEPTAIILCTYKGGVIVPCGQASNTNCVSIIINIIIAHVDHTRTWFNEHISIDINADLNVVNYDTDKFNELVSHDTSKLKQLVESHTFWIVWRWIELL